MHEDKQDPFKLIRPLVESISSGKMVISWNNNTIKHWEHLETEAKGDLKE